MRTPKEICTVPFMGNLINANFNIPENILDAYYAQVPQPQNKDSVSSSYVGKINHYNSPFSANVYGAYPIMIQWESLEYKMEHSDEDYFKAYKRRTVFTHLKAFAKGFQHGYDNFIKDKVTDSLVLSTTETGKAQSVMDYLSSSFDRFGFSEALGGDAHIFSGWHEDGIRAGYHYCAWALIFKNHALFEPFFNNAPKPQPLAEVISDKKDFTLPRQVLALHYLFEELGINQSEVSRKAKAEFAKLLTIKSYKNLYDALKDPFSTKEKEFRFDDLQFIRPYFENLGLKNIVREINRQLEQSH